MSSPSLAPGGPVEGQTLAGKYRIERVLGEGGMCVVYAAEHIHLRQGIALKVLKSELATDPTSVARFAQEAQAVAQLRSPNVARVYDVDRLPDGQPYITMELLVGHDLGVELQQRYALPVELAVDYVSQAANGIAEAHQLGIVHRDLKPENLFLTDLGEMTDRRLLKILDFGIAKNVNAASRKLTAPDAVFGTVDYMSPEQIRSAASVDHRTDIWSLGVILFELLTGRTPYGGDARSIIAQIVSDPVLPPSRYVPTLPPGLVAVVMKALAKDPAARFQSADELRRALAPFAAGVEPITAVLARIPPGSVPRRNPGASRPSMDGLRDARTNLSFEAGAPRKGWAKKAFALPLFAALGALAGLGVLKRDVLLDYTHWVTTTLAAAREARSAPSVPPVPSSPGVSAPPDAPSPTAATSPAAATSPMGATSPLAATSPAATSPATATSTSTTMPSSKVAAKVKRSASPPPPRPSAAPAPPPPSPSPPVPDPAPSPSNSNSSNLPKHL